MFFAVGKKRLLSKFSLKINYFSLQKCVRHTLAPIAFIKAKSSPGLALVWNLEFCSMRVFGFLFNKIDFSNCLRVEAENLLPVSVLPRPDSIMSSPGQTLPCPPQARPYHVHSSWEEGQEQLC